MGIRNHTNLKGVKLGNMEHAIALYADNVVLFSSNLKQTLPALVDLINYYGSFIGYKINYSKSMVLFMDEREQLNPPANTPFMVSTNGFTSLGVKIGPTIDKK